MSSIKCEIQCIEGNEEQEEEEEDEKKCVEARMQKNIQFYWYKLVLSLMYSFAIFMFATNVKLWIQICVFFCCSISCLAIVKCFFQFFFLSFVKKVQLIICFKSVWREIDIGKEIDKGREKGRKKEPNR